MKLDLTATNLRLLLLVAMPLVIILAVSGFWFAQTKLSEYARAISELNASAQSGDSDLQTLQSLESRLESQSETIKKARSIVAQSQQYQYQDQIVRDLSKIAQTSNVTITQFDFAQSAGATPAAPGPVGTTAPAASPSGLNSETVTVTIQSPLPYADLMNFIKAIELNPLKMQIANVSIVKDQGAMVTSPTFTIEVYVQ